MINKWWFSLAILIGITACQSKQEIDDDRVVDAIIDNSPYLLILGIAQDAGYPQAGCQRACCQRVNSDPSLKRLTTCLALVDPASGKRWLFEATPDFKSQLRRLDSIAPTGGEYPFDGIFLTHAHMGHYTGLANLGREVMGTQDTKVYAMPRMASYLENNGPWSQLVSLKNIDIRPIEENVALKLTPTLSVMPFVVPHRDEYSETVGFQIKGPKRQVVFIPDIDKWEKWSTNIIEIVEANDLLFLDGTFFQDGEIPGRDMKLIPHPFVTESLERFKPLPDSEKSKINFIHFNHTNPLLWPESLEYSAVMEAGYHVAKEWQQIPL